MEQRPFVCSAVYWETDECGIVTLHIANKGAMNRIFQKIFHKPKISYLHLDAMGSFVWRQMDGEASILSIGDALREQFGEDAEPLYPRLAHYVALLAHYGLVIVG